MSLDSVTVTVVMPVRNEAAHIASTLDSVLDQAFSQARTMIVVVDGRSSDGTRDIVAARAATDRRIMLLDNPRQTTSSSLNLAIARSDSDVVIRVDGHCRLARDYIQRCVEALERTLAGNAGGLMRPAGVGLIGRTIGLALTSRFGVGDSRFHYLEKEGFVDSVYLGAFRREVLEEVGGYDEGLIANEDFELNHRIRGAGYGVLLCPDIVSVYFPRESLTALCRQYYTYGLWKAQVIRKHPGSTQARHVAAPALVLTLTASAVVFVWTRRVAALLPAAIYSIAAAAAGALAARDRLRLAPAISLVFACMHLSWGIGVIRGLVRPAAGDRRR
jgi:glycosyltransferase involved in cell wall biosynthesis